MSLDEKVKALIEVLKIVAWPAIVAWIVWYLRDEVKRAAARVTKIGLTGAEFAPPPDQISSPPPSGGISAAASDHSLRADSGALVVTGSEAEVARKSPSSDASPTALFIANLKASISEDQLEPTRLDPSARTQVPILSSADSPALCYRRITRHAADIAG